MLTQRAGCLLSAGRDDEARAECDRALALDPDFRDAYLVRAMARARLDQTSAAQADIERFAALSRSSPSETWQGREAYRNDAKRGAYADVGQAQATIARSLERNHRPDDAADAYEKAIEFNPEDLNSRARRALILRSQRKNEAINEMGDVIQSSRFEELVGQDPYLLRISLYVVEHRLRNGASNEALAIAESALRIATRLRAADVPESPLVAESRYALARALAPGAVANPQTARRAADLLMQADRADPRFLRDLFPKDPFFDAARASIGVFLASSPIGSP